MKLLSAKLYDPGTAASKATDARLIMTALDTTNLRLAVTVPSHGFLRIVLRTCVTGATTFPSLLLGVLSGSTVIGRVTPKQTLGNTAVATARLQLEADFVVPGLTPGALTLDAAYGVETEIASTAIKYGGPDNTTADDAWGAFSFEVYDPNSFGNLDAAISSRMATYTQPTGFLAATFPTTVASTTNITAGTIATVTNLTNSPGAGDFTATMKTSLATAVAAALPMADYVAPNNSAIRRIGARNK